MPLADNDFSYWLLYFQVFGINDQIDLNTYRITFIRYNFIFNIGNNQ